MTLPNEKELATMNNAQRTYARKEYMRVLCESFCVQLHPEVYHKLEHAANRAFPSVFEKPKVDIRAVLQNISPNY